MVITRGGRKVFRKWKERDSKKLRQLEREFSALKLDYDLLRSEVRRLSAKVAEKEVTHVQRINVTVEKPFDYGGWYP
jgi:hypothetical protein